MITKIDMFLKKVDLKTSKSLSEAMSQLNSLIEIIDKEMLMNETKHPDDETSFVRTIHTITTVEKTKNISINFSTLPINSDTKNN